VLLCWREHFGFEFYAILAKPFVIAQLHESHLVEIPFRPTRALGMEVPLRIQPVFALSVNYDHGLTIRWNSHHSRGFACRSTHFIFTGGLWPLRFGDPALANHD
jgi:hypothetical protein